MADDKILQVFEKHDKFFFPISKAREARDFIRCLSEECVVALCQEVGVNEVAYTAWKMGSARADVSKKVISRINRSIYDVLQADDYDDDNENNYDDDNYDGNRQYFNRAPPRRNGTKLRPPGSTPTHSFNGKQADETIHNGTNGHKHGGQTNNKGMSDNLDYVDLSDKTKISENKEEQNSNDDSPKSNEFQTTCNNHHAHPEEIAASQFEEMEAVPDESSVIISQHLIKPVEKTKEPVAVTKESITKNEQDTSKRRPIDPLVGEKFQPAEYSEVIDGDSKDLEKSLLDIVRSNVGDISELHNGEKQNPGDEIHTETNTTQDFLAKCIEINFQTSAQGLLKNEEILDCKKEFQTSADSYPVHQANIDQNVLNDRGINSDAQIGRIPTSASLDNEFERCLQEIENSMSLLTRAGDCNAPVDMYDSFCTNEEIKSYEDGLYDTDLHISESEQFDFSISEQDLTKSHNNDLATANIDQLQKGLESIKYDFRAAENEIADSVKESKQADSVHNAAPSRQMSYYNAQARNSESEHKDNVAEHSNQLQTDLVFSTSKEQRLGQTTNCTDSVQTRLDQVTTSTDEGYLYVLTDSPDEAPLHRIQFGICNDPVKLLAQAKHFNVDIRLVTAILLRDKESAIRKIRDRLHEQKIRAAESDIWFSCSLITIQLIIAQVISQ